MKRTLVLLTALAAFLPLQAYAHEDGTLRFNHPLTAESPETDTKLRVDYIWQNAPGHHEDDGKVKTHTARLTGEYAFSKSAGGGGGFPFPMSGAARKTAPTTTTQAIFTPPLNSSATLWPAGAF